MSEIKRDRYGRPLITPAGGGTPVPYARSSSYGDVLEDRSNLEKWKTRMAVKGLGLRPDLHLAASTTPLEEKGRLNWIADQAIEAAGGSRASNTGTAIHALTEYIDRGEPLPPYPAEYAKDLEAYREIVARFEMVHIEVFLVCDELQVAGTPDRLMRSLWEHNRSELLVGDLKTGTDNRYLGKHACQLAIYAHSAIYDPETGERTPINVNQRSGYIFHAPASQGRCDLYHLDLEAGWEAALLAADVRRWRKRKGLAVPA